MLPAACGPLQNISATVEADLDIADDLNDNHITRTYAGDTIAWLPHGEITQSHADRAMANLDQFTLVLVLEKLDDAAWELLGYTMNLTRVQATQKRRGTHYSALKPEKLLLPGTLARLQRSVQYDAQVYEHACRLHARNVAAWALLKSGAAAGVCS